MNYDDPFSYEKDRQKYFKGVLWKTSFIFYEWILVNSQGVQSPNLHK